jgi:hypothetical protein
MSPAEAHLLTLYGERPTMQMVSFSRRLDTPDDGTSDYCGAPMSNDCQTLALRSLCEAVNLIGVSAQGQRLGPQIGMRRCRFAGYPGDQIKAAGQEGIVEFAWVPIVPLWGTPRWGMRWRQCVTRTPALRRGPSCHPARVERECGERTRKAPQIEREAK